MIFVVQVRLFDFVAIARHLRPGIELQYQLQERSLVFRKSR